MIKYSETVLLVVKTCCVCGTPYGIESNLNHSLLQNGNSFFCPNGHGQVYSEPIDKKVKMLEQQVKYLREDKEFYKAEAEHKARQLSATKGVLTRTKNRISKGVCPCCNRQFMNVHRHMENQHPYYLMENNNE